MRMQSAHAGRDRQLEVLPGGHRCGLVEPPHALLDAALDDQRRALDRDAQGLEIGDAQLGAERRGLAWPCAARCLGVGATSSA